MGGSVTALFYDGPSLIDGSPIVGLLSGLDGESNNPKTGPVCQAYILCRDKGPMDAVRDGSDVAICGDCALRGDGGYGRRCYVTPFLGPLQVWKRYAAGECLQSAWPDLQALVEGRTIRLGAYGDPVAIPFEVWRMLLVTAASWVGYSHSWTMADPRFKSILMASVDTPAEWYEAQADGWRTFRIRRPGEQLIDGAEFVCPASDEAGHKVTCAQCRLCRGTSSPARSVAIYVHGKPSSLKAFGLRPRDVKQSGQFDNLRRSSIPKIGEGDPPRQPELPPLRAKFYRRRSEAIA